MSFARMAIKMKITQILMTKPASQASSSDGDELSESDSEEL